MSDFTKIAELMRSDWDRRITHDYRFWMSDGYQSDEAMWHSGERDLSILLEGVAPEKIGTFLEVGCGVGRILRAAAARFKRVIGIDVSAKAIDKAQELLPQFPHIELHKGNGFDLSCIENAGVDLAVCFASISSIPTPVVANYFREIHRVLRPGALLKMQLYVGSEQAVRSDDTLHLRCYTRENLEKGLALAGFALEAVNELTLPIQVSFKEIGIEAVIVSAKKEERISAPSDLIARALLPSGELTEGESTLGQDLEYWMSVNYARELAEGGDPDKAKKALEYAATVSKTTAIDVSDLLGKIVTHIEKKPAQESPNVEGNSFREQNYLCLAKQFPLLAERFSARMDFPGEVRATSEGKTLWYDGQCLDHPEKPRGAAEKWVKAQCQFERFERASDIIVVGIGGGYHLSALVPVLQRAGKKLFVIEPRPEVFAQCLEERDQRDWIQFASDIQIGREAVIPSQDPNCELWIRPQTQAIEPEVCIRLRSEFYGVRGLSLLHPSIAVLGPLQGGTLPIMAYVSRALGSLNQRVRELDVSGFAPGYHQLDHFVKDPQRKNAVEGYYCEMVSQVILQAIEEKPIDILICMALAPISPRVLEEVRKRGIITVLWFVEDYGRFTYWQQVAKYFDFVFTIQKGKCIDAIRAAGASEVHYLPVGCDPGIHAPLELSPEERLRWGSPVSFMGAGYHNRQQLLASLAEMPLKIWGTEWPTCRPFDRLVQEGGRRLTPAEYVKVFNATDININLHSSHERDGVDPFGDFLNPRTFELASSGVFQLIDQRSLLAEAFDIGSEMVTFRSAAELKEKIEYYLAHPEERIKAAQKARTRALKEHTYTHRIRKMLSIIYSSKYEQLRGREEAGPWKKVLTRAARHSELSDRCEAAFSRGEEPTLDALVSDIVTGKGKLTETEQKLMFLYHVRKQIIRMRQEERGGKS